ncbi:hypothetical protein BDV38DRAFT_100346 [Aspergillus pseudotamarii]|uniref:HNH nuclease domain-containing protein n=1 Tax=Aspergillus pseudotamarii TaxID=132259 RepID=A0A5N6SQU7_ASPPS|nr:uncharacterized protein BDV38DRAFT_100346 [Aspergillus pseudotamarii]KAE8137066.1 hypothetical protein BDV38DRAFT_100346 [Aspergillus pseudotamarii]
MSSPSEGILSPTISTDFTVHQQIGETLSARLDRYTSSDVSDKTVHFLRTFFRCLSLDGKSNLVEDVDSCETDEDLRKLWRHIDTGIMIPMLANGGKTPCVSPSPRLGYQSSFENIFAENFDPVTRSDQSALRDACLARDNYQCVISKVYDPKNRPLNNTNYAPLQAAYIIPFSMGTYRQDEEELEMCKVWMTLYRYFPELRSRLNHHSSDVNSVENAMMLLSPLHAEFGAFHFIFEKTNTVNKYRLKTFRGFSGAYTPYLPTTRVVNFTSHDPRYALPDVLLLGVHAAIGNFLNASGRGEQIEKMVRDMRSGGSGLASDGSTDIELLLSAYNLRTPTW